MPLLPFRHLTGAGGSTGTIVHSGHNNAQRMTVPVNLAGNRTISGTAFWMLAAGRFGGSNRDTGDSRTGSTTTILSQMPPATRSASGQSTVPGGGSTAGVAFVSGKAGPDATLVFADLALMIVFVVRKIRK